MRTLLVLLLFSGLSTAVATADEKPGISDALEAYDGGRIAESADILKQLVALGDSEAATMLAGFYETGQLGQVNLARAAALYHRAALAGNRHAQAKYADYLSAGRGGLTRDLAQSLCWFKKAARAGHNWARDRLAEERRKDRGRTPPAPVCR